MSKNSITVLVYADIERVGGGVRNMKPNFLGTSGGYDKFLRKDPVRFSLSSREPLKFNINLKELSSILLTNGTSQVKKEDVTS